MMRMKFAVPAAIATACLSFAGAAQAATYTETGDAGDLPATAQIVSGTAGTALTALSGGLTLTNGTSDSDLFQIYISSPSTFSASVTAFIPGANSFDSQLALFRLNGQGVALDDDDPNSGSPQSNLPAGSSQISSLTAGVYYLLISGSGRYAATAAGGSLIFANFTDGTTDPTVVEGPNNAASVLGGYTGSSNEGGNYTIALNGAQFVPAAVPEPGSWALLLAGAAGVTAFARPRRTA